MDFPLAGHDETIRIFTTRPDTLFGATYMVLAPEHRWYRWSHARAAPSRRCLPRQGGQARPRRAPEDRQDKTGVFTGAYCVNPVNGAEIPVWIADYVLMGYGTGAIMAVPGHDTRDFEFAEAFDLPIVRVVAAPGEAAETPLEAAFVGDGTLVNSGDFDGVSVPTASGDRRLARRTRRRRGADQLPPTRLVCVPATLLGTSHPDHPLPRVRPVPVPEAELPVELPHLAISSPTTRG